MRKFALFLLSIFIAGVIVYAADWPTASGSPQRDGWAKAEKSFTSENAKGIELLYKYKADNVARGMNSLSAPLVVGNLITYLGFKEMAVFGGADTVYSVDADLNRLIWKAKYPWKADKPQAAATNLCPGGMTAPVTMPGSSAAGPGRGAPGRGAPGRAGTQPQPVNARPPAPAGPRQALFTAGFGRAGVFALVTGDGFLHVLNTSLGTDKIDPIPFVPPNSKVNALNIDAGTIYAATADGCGGNPNGLYAIDMLADQVKVASFMTNGSGLSGMAGTSIGFDGTVFAQAPDGHGDVAGDYRDTVLALTAKELKVRDYFTPASKGESKKGAGATPVLFQYKGKELIVAGSQDGRLFLLDASSPGGSDHHTPLFATDAPAAAAQSFASWEDAAGTRWIYATLADKIAAYKVEDRDGKPTLAAAWTSRELTNPAAPVTSNGLVFALSGGDQKRPAVLYALDGSTGKELYSSGNATSTFSHGSGLAVANSRIYLTTHDNTMYCFGFFAEQPQLTGK